MIHHEIEEIDHDKRNAKRLRLIDPDQNNDSEQKSAKSSLSLSNSSNRVSALTTNSMHRLSASSTPSMSLSSSEDEPISSMNNAEKIEDKITVQIPSTNIDQPQERKRNQRKPIRKKPTQLLDGINSQHLIKPSIKDERCDTDDNSVTISTISDDNQSAAWKKPGTLSKTGGNQSDESINDNRASLNNSSTYKWLHHAFRSLVPPQASANDVDTSIQQSPRSSKHKIFLM